MKGYIIQLLWGAATTIELARISFLIGLLLGISFFLFERTNLVIKKITNVFVNLVRALPELVVLFAVYFGSETLLNMIFGRYINVSPFLTGTITLALIFAAYSKEAFQAAFKKIPRAQIESAKALGLSSYRIWRAVEWPLIWRFSLPALGNLWLVLLKDTAIVSLIGLAELMNRAQVAASSLQKPFPFYMGAALIYLLFTSISQFCFHKLSNTASKHLHKLDL